MNESTKESRKSPRKKTLLDGFYGKASTPGVFEDMKRMTVVNLSLGGCCLLVSKDEKLDRYNRMKLVFNLDNARHTRIKMEAVICRVVGNQIGCRFLPDLTGYEPDLVAYLSDQTKQK
jgi:hypothetical protein